MRDKLYWRKVSGRWHCFKKCGRGGYVSLCGSYELQKSGGQTCDRPFPYLRCGVCDGAEMDRRGWDESGPEHHTRT